MDSLSMLYGIISSLVCYVVWWFAIVAAMILILKFVRSEKRKEQKQQRGQPLYNGGGGGGGGRFSTHTALFFANAHLRNEMKNVLLVSLLLVLYLVALMPYIIRTKIDQIAQVRGIKETALERADASW